MQKTPKSTPERQALNARMLSIYLSSETNVQAIRKLAFSQGKSASRYVRDLIESALGSPGEGD
jgi:hypothetical protein